MIGPRYSLRQLEYFLAASEAGTISGASERCHVSQPAVSQALSELERAFGVQLIMRRRAKGVTLTVEGNRLLGEARKLLASAAQLQSSTLAPEGQVAGTLRLGCYLTLAPTTLPGLLAITQRRHPLVELRFDEDSQPALESKLLSGRLEVALMYAYGRHADLDSVTVGHERMHVLLPEDHPKAGDADVSLVELATEPMVLFDVAPSRENWHSLVARLGIEPVVSHRTKSFELARCLVGSGHGYAVLIQRAPSGITYMGDRVVAKPIREELPGQDVILAYPRATRLTQRAEALKEVCLEMYAVRGRSGEIKPAPRTAEAP